MQILDKYVTKNFLAPFLYCIVLFTALYVIIDLFGHLDEILKNNIPLPVLYQYYASMIPFIFTHTSPVSSLICTIYVISNMNKHDEITAMRAAGINMYKILAPFFLIGLALSIIIFALSEKVLPESMKNAETIKENYIEQQRDNNEENNIKTLYNLALYGKGNKLIFIESYDNSSKKAGGITLLTQDDKGNVTGKTNAKSAEWTGSEWLGKGVLIYSLDDEGMVEGTPWFFDEKTLDIEKPEEIMSKGGDYEFMSFKELSNYIKNFSDASPKITRRLSVDLHQKLSFPFTSLVVIIIGAAFATKIKRRGKTAAIMGMGATLIIGFAYYVFMATCLALGKGGILPPPIAAHLANAVFGGTGLILIRN